MQSVEKLIEKLQESKRRIEARLEKKIAAAEKVGMNISEEEWFNIRDNITDEQYIAHFELSVVRDELKDIERRISVNSKTLEKTSAKVRAHHEAVSKEEAERKKADEIKRWAEDGITVDQITSNTVSGKTPNGKHFSIFGNNGFAERSRHCFTLYIDGNMIFTSGEFYRAYRAVKNA